MFRFGVRIAAIAMSVCLALGTFGGASAQPGEKKKGEAPAARPAPQARPAAPPRSAPPPAASRPSPPPAIARPAPAARPAPPPQRPAAAPQRQAPPAAARIPQRQERIQQRVQQRQERIQGRAQPRAPERRDAMPDRAQTRQERIRQGTQDRQDRVQQRVKGQPDVTRKTAQDRREQLQQKLKQGNLNRGERRQFRALERQEQNVQRAQQREELRLKNAERRLNRLQATQEHGGRLNRSQQRELLRLQSTQQQRERLQARERQPDLRQGISQDQRAGRRAQRVTQQQAQAGRFGAIFQSARHGDRAERRAIPQALRIAARAAWQRGAYASYVPWLGAVYWPYAYTDVFHYTFWPYAYEPSYWAYAYDDFFDGVFFPDGAPYIEYADGLYEGPYARATTGAAPNREPPGHMTQAARQVCAEPDKGVTAWPFERIAQAVQLKGDQKALLEDLEQAADKAAEGFKQACPESVPMTPPGRLQAMTIRLQATLDAVKLVRPPLEKFYESLSDEQKARFNEIGPELGRDRERTARSEPQQKPQQGDCGGAKAGLSSLAIDRIEERVQPTEAQFGALDRLSEAVNKAVDTLQAACPTTIPLTPVGRLEVMQQRLEAMIEAANTVRPALQDFYASLSNEQKAKFNRLGRQTAQSNN
jgi:hypothetical protein